MRNGTYSGRTGLTLCEWDLLCANGTYSVRTGLTLCEYIFLDFSFIFLSDVQTTERFTCYDRFRISIIKVIKSVFNNHAADFNVLKDTAPYIPRPLQSMLILYIISQTVDSVPTQWGYTWVQVMLNIHCKNEQLIYFLAPNSLTSLGLRMSVK